VLCVDPSEPLASALARLEGQPVGGRKLHVRTTQAPGPGCHLAFMSISAGPAQIATLKRQGVLTVGEAPDFAKSGAIGLVSIGRQIRFEINATTAREAGVTLSSQLLRLATRVRP
jgi:hypothetical protein